MSVDTRVWPTVSVVGQVYVQPGGGEGTCTVRVMNIERTSIRRTIGEPIMMLDGAEE